MGIREHMTPEVTIRFFDKVDPTSRTGCWEWRGAKRNGYGQFGIGGKTLQAHRVMWSCWHREIFEYGQYVCHRCDNPSCVNPLHLFLGTQSENMKDMVKKGRGGCGGYKLKLNEAKIKDIRKAYRRVGVTQQYLADEYGVSHAHINSIVHRRSWRKVKR